MSITIRITDAASTDQTITFEKAEVTIGRISTNDIVLSTAGVSQRNSALFMRAGKLIVVDMQSTNGTFVNGKQITAPQVVNMNDKISIGEYTLEVMALDSSEGNGEAPAPPRTFASEPVEENTNPGLEEFHEQATPATGIPIPPLLQASAAEDPLSQRLHRLALRLLDGAEAKAESAENPLTRWMKR